MLDNFAIVTGLALINAVLLLGKSLTLEKGGSQAMNDIKHFKFKCCAVYPNAKYKAHRP